MKKKKILLFLRGEGTAFRGLIHPALICSCASHEPVQGSPNLFKPIKGNPRLFKGFWKKYFFPAAFQSATFNVYHVPRGATNSGLFRPIGTNSGPPPPHPCLFDVPCSAFNVQIPYYPSYPLRLCCLCFLLFKLNQPTLAKMQTKSRPMPAKKLSTCNLYHDIRGSTLNLKTPVPYPMPRMNLALDSLGLIAGNRSLPLEFARQARAAGVKKLVAVAFENETDPALAKLVDEIVWLRVGQLSKMISAFTDCGVKQCVMAGQIAPKNLFDLRPDLRAMSLLFKIKEKNAHTIFGAIADELKKDGVELIEATPWLTPLMPGKGFHLGPKLSAEQKADVEFGFRIAKEVTRLEIGQTVVVKNGVVLAVEGFEGTDKCLTRGGELAGRDGCAVAVKVAREKHDMRFDIPCLGAKTLEVCAAARISVLAVEAGKTLLLEREACERLANKDKISLTTV